MRVLSESWCFCNGGAKSERLKASIFTTKTSSIVKISSSCSTDSGLSSSKACGTGILIHKNLLLTTHCNLASVYAAESAAIWVHNGVPATLMPHRLFITSSVLDLTVVGLDTIDGDSVTHGQQAQLFKPCLKPTLGLGDLVYLLGHAEKKELTIGEGKVVIATDNLIKLSTEGFTWSPGSAGFDCQGNLAFMICDPMKIATPSTTSSSPSSLQKDLHMQFGIPIPIIFDWLHQHWKGNLDDLSKTKLPLTRLMSIGHRREHSCGSFTMRQVFKATEEIDVTASSASNTMSTPRDHSRQGCLGGIQTSEGQNVISHLSRPPSSSHTPGIPTPDIYESPRVTANPVKTGPAHIRLLDISFSPRISKPIQTLSPKREKQLQIKHDTSTGSMESSCLPASVSQARDEMSSEGETLYSAETAESRNYSSPREERFRPVGRSQSSVSYHRWGLVRQNPVLQRSSLEKQRSYMQPRKTYSQGTPSHKTMDYFSPTVSSIIKKRNNMEQQPINPQPPLVKPRTNAFRYSHTRNF